MRVIVVSDSHGATGRLSTILTVAEQAGPIDAIIHLGDGYYDLRDLEVALPPVYQVAGNCDLFRSDTLDFVTLSNAKLLLTHGHYQHVREGTDDLLSLALEEKCAAALSDRRKDRFSMVESLAGTGRWFVSSQSFDAEINGEAFPKRLTEVLYSYLATAPCRLLLVQLEDLLGQKEQMNMPGTSDEYPNWRHKLPMTVTEMRDSEEMKHLCSIIRENRR